MKISLSTCILILSLNLTIMAQEPDIMDILDRYDSTQAKINKFIADETTEIESIGRKGIRHSYKESTFAYDGNRVHHQYRQWPRLESRTVEKKPEEADSRAYLWNNSAQYEYRKEVGIPGKLFVNKDNDMSQVMISLGYSGAPLMGIFLGDHENVGTILRSSKSITLRLEKEQINGSLCHVIDAKTDNGQYTVWIDPDHGYNISKATMKKQQGDLAWGKPLGWVSNKRAPYTPKAIPYKTLLFTLDNVRFQEVNNTWIPIQASYENIFERNNGTSSSNVHFRRKKVMLNPDFEALQTFEPDIPDGTHVWIREASGIAYEWKNGKPVAVVDQSFLDVLDKEINTISTDAEVVIKVASNRKADVNGQEAKISRPKTVSVTNMVKGQPGAKSGSNSFVVFTLAVTFAIVIIGCLIFCKIKSKAS